MSESIVVFGPPGCGKTTNANRIRKAMGLKFIADGIYESTGIPRRSLQDTLILVTDPNQLHKSARHLKTITYESAMKAVNGSGK